MDCMPDKKAIHQFSRAINGFTIVNRIKNKLILGPDGLQANHHLFDQTNKNTNCSTKMKIEHAD